MPYIIESIALSKLNVDLQNPRFDPLQHQRAALQKQLDPPYGAKLVALAGDIADNGLSPTELILVTRHHAEIDQYIVREGNRRITALKLMHDEALRRSLHIRPRMKARLDGFAAQVSAGATVMVPCAVFEAHDPEVRHWIELKHTGENEGAGVVLCLSGSALLCEGGWSI